MSRPELDGLPGLPEQSTPATHRNAVRVLSLNELLTLEDPEYLIERWLPENSLAILYAERESFKSFLLLSWAFHIATGREWFGHQVKAGAVVYIAAEGGRGMAKRARAQLEAMRLDPSEVPFLTVPHAVDITDLAMVQEAIRGAEEALADLTPDPIVLVIVDTYSRATPGRSSKDDLDWSLALRGAELIQRLTGGTVVFADHANKSGEGGATGTHQKEASADAVFFIKREAESDFATLKTRKQKDFEHAPDLEFRMVKTGGSLVLTVPDEPAPRVTEDLNASLRKALEYLARLEDGSEGVAPTTWMSATGLASSTFHLARAHAVRGKLVEAKELKGNRRLYRLTVGGRELMRGAISNCTPSVLQLEESGMSTPIPPSRGVGVDVPDSSAKGAA